VTDYERIDLFVSYSTGTVHKAATYKHGRGPECVEQWMLGRVVSGLVRDLTCLRCQGKEEPTYDVVFPDKRYSTGYRVVHEAIEDKAQAEALAEETPRSWVIENDPQADE
jgi:hypothetical protein